MFLFSFIVLQPTPRALNKLKRVKVSFKNNKAIARVLTLKAIK